MLVSTGADVTSLTRFTVYQLASLLWPGALLYILLASGPTRVSRFLAFAWTFGYLAELGAFSAAAAAGHHELGAFGLHYSPTFLLGLVFFVAFTIEIVEHTTEWRFDGARVTRLTLLLIGCVGAKGLLIPLLLCALTGLLLWRFATSRRIDPTLSLLVASSAILFVALYSFATSRTGSLSWVPFESVRITSLVRTWPVALGLPVALAGVLGVRLLGVVSAIVGVNRPTNAANVWLLLLFLASLGPFYLMGTREYASRRCARRQ